MRDYSNFDQYYQELLGDVYPQPIDDGHLENMTDIITRWVVPLGGGTILDVGCGYGEAGVIFSSFGFSYTGVTLAEGTLNVSIFVDDYNFLPDVSADIIFSRHSLEHSPFPIITLMEWHRVSKRWLCLVLPNPEHYTYSGRNHYSVMNAHHAAWILRRAGWKMSKVSIGHEEMWFLCEKAQRISYEGWAEEPLHNKVYEFERDLNRFKGEIDVHKYFVEREWNGLF